MAPAQAFGALYRKIRREWKTAFLTCFVLGLLIGKTADTALRRALMQYSGDLLGMVTRPFGLVILGALLLLCVVELRHGSVRKQD